MNGGKGNRIDKLNSEFKKEIYEIITRKIKNPFITEMFSIVKVDASKDLSNAKVYLSVFSTNETRKKATFDAIVGEAKRIRYELAKTSNIRTVPELRFIDDDSMAYGDKMDKIFAAIKEKENQ